MGIIYNFSTIQKLLFFILFFIYCHIQAYVSFFFCPIRVQAAQTNSFQLTQIHAAAGPDPATPGFAEAIVSRAPL